MLLMGYYSLDPLGKGFFRVDPAITLPPEALAFYSETTSFRAAGAGKVTKELSQEVVERVSKEIAGEVSQAVSQKVGKNVTEAVAQKTSKEVMQQAYKNVQERDIKKNGKELSGAALTSALKKEAKNLATESLEASSKKVAKTTAKTTGKKTTKKGAQKEARETAVERYAKHATTKGLIAATAFGILKVPAEALADVIGDTADTFLGNDCNREDTEEKYPDESSEQIDARMEACEAEGFKRTMMLGAAGLGIVGILGALIVTRLVPKKEPPQPKPESPVGATGATA